MEPRTCLCGAQPDLRQETRATADGGTETLYWIGCPVCGQLGPKVSDLGKDKETAIAEAIAAWNEKLNRARPL
ncbi:MAG: hypothetical protein WCC36_02020 [Gammaproteobacteria bacterium]